MRKRSSSRLAHPRLEQLEVRETPSAGLLDPTFGTHGLVIGSPAGWTGGAVIVQPDGKILAAGSSSLSATTGFGPPAVFRFNANGTPDQTFGKKGMEVIPFTSGGPAMGNIDSLLLQPSGKIVVEVHSQVLTSGFSQAVVRLTSSGQLDPTFGTAGKAVEQVGGRPFLIAQVFAQPGGKLAAVVALAPHAQQPAQVAVMHYTADGKPDSVFGKGGLVVLAGASPHTEDGTIQPDGKTILVAEGGNIPNSTVVVSRFTAGGALDKTFHGTGSVRVTRPGRFQIPNELAGVTLQRDGKILVTDGSAGFTVMRLNPDGTLDKGFGAGGVETVQAGNLSYMPGSAPVVQGDGKILLPGNDDAFFTLVRLTPAGLPDPTFGADGVVVTMFPDEAMLGSGIASLALQPDGKVVASGSWGSPQGPGLALARYQTTAGSAANVSHISLTASPATAGSPVTLTATVTGSHGRPTGSVTFLDGTTIIGAAAIMAPGGQAVLTTISLGGGKHHVTAVYSGDVVYRAGSTAVSVTVKPVTATVTLTAGIIRNGHAVSFKTDVTPPMLPFSLPMTGSVTFYDGTRVLGTVPVTTPSVLTSPMEPAVAVLQTSDLGPGSHAITAKYTGDPNFVSVPSAAVTVKRTGDLFSISSTI
jgi:uncharacterized delta-60 repeat protein